MPDVLVVLAVIALVLHIVFTYLLLPYGTPPSQPSNIVRLVIAVIIIVAILLFWFVIPVHIGRT